MVLLELPADVLERVLLHLDLAGLCSMRRVAGASGDAIRTLVASDGFRAAWIEWQKTLELSLQRTLLTSLRPILRTAAEREAAASLVSKLRMVTVAPELSYELQDEIHTHDLQPDEDPDEDEDEDEGPLVQTKACFCSLVGFEFGQFVPVSGSHGSPSEQTGDAGILAVASWTSAELTMGEEPDSLLSRSYAALHLHLPTPADGENACREVCRVADESGNRGEEAREPIFGDHPNATGRMSPHSGPPILQLLEGVRLVCPEACERLPLPTLLTTILCAGAAWLRMGYTANGMNTPDEYSHQGTWLSLMSARARFIHQALSAPLSSPEFERQHPPHCLEGSVCPGMRLDEWCASEETNLNTQPGATRGRGSRYVLDRFFRGMWGILPAHEADVHRRVYGGDGRAARRWGAARR